MAESAQSIKVVEAAGPVVSGVGKYRYIAMLAEGGMADVFLAVTQSAGFEKLVVIKQLRHRLSLDPTFVTMFMDEARLAARLNHPNVIQTLEVGSEAGLHFLAMEFLEGVAYVRFARSKDRVPAPLAYHLRVLVDVLRGLHYAHELKDFDGKPLNVVHRDVSPQNVMITFAGNVKILDFGIAKAALAQEVRPEDFKGKLEYMAPEQARRESVDRRADIFSVGVMMFEALSRRRLFRKGDDKLALLLAGSLPDVLDDAPQTPKALAKICAKAMDPDRDRRYANAEQMADEIEDWLTSTTQHVTAREVGTFVAEKFASTREKINAAIEAQLALFRSLQETAPDTLPLSRLPFTEAPPADYSDPSVGMLVPPIGPPPMLTASGEGPSVVLREEELPPPKTSSASLTIFGVIAGVALVFGAIFIATRESPKPVVIEAAPPPASIAKAPENAPAEIRLTLRTTPSDVKIFVDDQPVPVNPVTRPRDPGTHTIRVEAPGYEAREESVTFDQNVLLAIDLRPAAPGEPGPVVHHRPKKHPPLAPSASASGSAKAPEDPYNPL